MLIARGEHLAAIREHGLRVDSIKGDFVATPAMATDNPAEAGIVDVVILGVKAWQVIDAAKAMRPMVGPNTFVVPMQNGVEAPAQLASVLGEKAVVIGLGGMISYIVGPGHILHAGSEPFVSFGESDDSPSDRTQRLLEAFQNAGVTANIPANINPALWGKLAFMAANSGVGAITRVPVGQWRSVAGSWEMAQQVVKEVLVVAHAKGINMPVDSLPATIARLESSHPSQRDFVHAAGPDGGKAVRVGSPKWGRSAAWTGSRRAHSGELLHIRQPAPARDEGAGRIPRRGRLVIHGNNRHIGFLGSARAG